MNRRVFVTGLGAVLAGPVAGAAQQAEKLWRIGYVGSGPLECPPTAPTRAFRQGLLDAGYVEGRDFILDRRCIPATDVAENIVDDVLRARPDVGVMSGEMPALIVRKRAPSLPVVFVDVSDPVGIGLVQTLARPGTNMTGLSSLTQDLYAKRVQLLREALPEIRAISTLSTAGSPSAEVAYAHQRLMNEQTRAEIERAVAKFGWRVRHVTVNTASDLPAAFQAMKKDRTDAFIVSLTAMFWAERVRIANLAAQYRLPGMYPFGAQVEAGGLIGYGAEQNDLYRRTAGYVVKIFRGAKPGDLPVEQPTKFELVINLKTAKALELTIPPSLLARADRVIE